MHKELEHYLANLYPLLQRAGIICTEHRELEYGVQLRLAKDRYTSTLNVYHSEKKGISTVIGGKDPNPLKELLHTLCGSARNTTPKPKGFHEWNSWIGSDESGKGDYFGAPVACAFAYDKSLAEHFAILKIRDSKQMDDSEIVKTAKILYSKYPKRISCIALKPVKYNELIASFQRQGKNLNDLLTWLHVTCLENLIGSQSEAQGILVDQFSLAQKVRRTLKEKKCPLPCIERPGAEADPAVAAASIIARYQFLEGMNSLNKLFGIKFPFGAANTTITTAVEFCRKYGFNRLGEVAKLHFKTTEKVQAKLK